MKATKMGADLPVLHPKLILDNSNCGHRPVTFLNEVYGRAVRKSDDQVCSLRETSAYDGVYYTSLGGGQRLKDKEHIPARHP
jgi:hypothetical protein